MFPPWPGPWAWRTTTSWASPWAPARRWATWTARGASPGGSTNWPLCRWMWTPRPCGTSGAGTSAAASSTSPRIVSSSWPPPPASSWIPPSPRRRSWRSSRAWWQRTTPAPPKSMNPSAFIWAIPWPTTTTCTALSMFCCWAGWCPARAGISSSIPRRRCWPWAIPPPATTPPWRALPTGPPTPPISLTAWTPSTTASRGSSGRPSTPGPRWSLSATGCTSTRRWSAWSTSSTGSGWTSSPIPCAAPECRTGTTSWGASPSPWKTARPPSAAPTPWQAPPSRCWTPCATW